MGNVIAKYTINSFEEVILDPIVWNEGPSIMSMLNKVGILCRRVWNGGMKKNVLYFAQEHLDLQQCVVVCKTNAQIM